MQGMLAASLFQNLLPSRLLSGGVNVEVRHGVSFCSLFCMHVTPDYLLLFCFEDYPWRVLTLKILILRENHYFLKEGSSFIFR